MTAVIAYSRRLLLREFVREDIEWLDSLMSDPRVMRYSVSGPLSRAKSQERLEHIRQSYKVHGAGLYAVILRTSGECLGYCGFIRQQLPGGAEWEIGYRLLPHYWGLGYATEAARAVRRLGEKQFRFARMISIIDPGNTASIAVARKIGMRYERDTEFHGKEVRIYAWTGPEKALAPETG